MEKPKIDILYLACGRPEFTQASLTSLLVNTNPLLVDRLFICLDGGPHFKLPATAGLVIQTMFRHFVNVDRLGGPVAIMNKFLANGPTRPPEYPDFLTSPASPIFAKIDNDAILPPGWLDAAAAVMEENPGLDVLGIEPPASRTPSPGRARRMTEPEWNGRHFHWKTNERRGYAATDSVGGVGLFRRSAFAGRPPMVPHHSGRGGFGEWQTNNPAVTKGWIVPPLKLFLLDRLPFEPWLSLSAKYNAEGIQRPWTNYDLNDAEALWGWWKP